MSSSQVRAETANLSRILGFSPDERRGLDSFGSFSFSSDLTAFHHRLSEAARTFSAVPSEKREKVARRLARDVLAQHLPEAPLARADAHTVADLVGVFDVRGAVLEELRPNLEKLVCKTVAQGRGASVGRLIELLGDEFKASPQLAAARVQEILTRPDYSSLGIGERSTLRSTLRRFKEDPAFVCACDSAFFAGLESGDLSIRALGRLDTLTERRRLYSGRALMLAYHELGETLTGLAPAKLDAVQHAALTDRFIALGTILYGEQIIGQNMLGRTREAHQETLNTFIARGMDLSFPAMKLENLQFLFTSPSLLYGDEQRCISAANYVHTILHATPESAFWSLRRAMRMFPEPLVKFIRENQDISDAADAAIAKYGTTAAQSVDKMQDALARADFDALPELAESTVANILGFFSIARALRGPGQSSIRMLRQPGMEESAVFIAVTSLPPGDDFPNLPVASEISSELYPDHLGQNGGTLPLVEYLKIRNTALQTLELQLRAFMGEEMPVEHRFVERRVVKRLLSLDARLEKAETPEQERYLRGVLADVLRAPSTQRALFGLCAPKLAMLAAAYERAYQFS